MGRTAFRMVFAATIAGAAGLVALLLGTAVPHSQTDDELSEAEVLKLGFVRPDGVPHPSANPATDARIALGGRLFDDKRLSGNGSLACSTCHVPAKGFADALALGTGIAGTTLARHTPALWNLAWSDALFWDGRAGSLEEQANGPIENPLEMGAKLPDVVARLAADETMRKAFAEAFPHDPHVTAGNLDKALAAFERTLVSPPTRFDRWVDGDKSALTRQEIRGFSLFVGKAGCVACHSGWAFTDNSFQDIGLAGSDRGRGAIINLPAVDHAFKVPTLRELAWTAPYMHDGSLATLEEVIDHYQGGIVDRPTLSPDLTRIALTEEERADLIAFLKTLSSETLPVPMKLPPASVAEDPDPAEATRMVAQKNKTFAPGRVRIGVGETLTIVNDDKRTHNVRVDDPRMKSDSGAQEPGQSVKLTFGEPGTFTATCGIHPSMRLDITVEAPAPQGAKAN